MSQEMGKILKFTKEMVERASEKISTRGPLRVGDLNGERPKGHPKIFFGPRGKVILSARQVWVEETTQELWRIKSVAKVRVGCLYPFDVTFYRVGTRASKRTLRTFHEREFREKFQVWDRFVENHRALMLNVGALGDSPQAEGLRRVLRVNKQGYR